MTPALEAALMEAAALVLNRARAFIAELGINVTDELTDKALAKVRELIRQDPGITNAATLIVEDDR